MRLCRIKPPMYGGVNVSVALLTSRVRLVWYLIHSSNSTEYVYWGGRGYALISICLNETLFIPFSSGSLHAPSRTLHMYMSLSTVICTQGGFLPILGCQINRIIGKQLGRIGALPGQAYGGDDVSFKCLAAITAAKPIRDGCFL